MESKLYYLEALEPRLLLSGDGMAVYNLPAPASTDASERILEDLFTDNSGVQSADSRFEAKEEPVDILAGLFTEDLNPPGGDRSSDSPKVEQDGKILDSSEPVRQVLFIDSKVQDQETLMKAVLPGTDVFLLNSVQDGVVQMANALKGYSGLASVQVFSDDMPGLLEIGRGPPGSSENVSQFSSEWTSLASSLAKGGDLLLFGSGLGSGSEGRAFVEAISKLTGLDVAASSDPNGVIVNIR